MANNKIKQKNKIILIFVVTLLILILGVVGYFLFIKQKKVVFKENEETNNLIQRRIDGVLVNPGEADLYPVAVMVENMTTARPQSGLDEANIVYEALVEGGITRFMALYAGEHAQEIGPVRSSRPYYLDWVKEYDALYVHCGGSNLALKLIDVRGIKDLDQITGGGASRFFWRDKNRYAPHNLYTKTDFLNLALRDAGLIDQKPNYDSWLFKDDKKLEERLSDEKFLEINFSTNSYKVRYEYDRENNVYLRYLGGLPHKDKISGNQLRAKNIILQYVKARLIDAEHLEMDTIGEGKAMVFRDGEAILGTWKKLTRESRTEFFDKKGQKIELNRGNIWIEIVPPDREVKYN